jgi:lactoylglutathione lyase
MQINHLHLSVTDVAACAEFFVEHFDFNLVDVKGNNGLAVLRGRNNTVLVLMRLPAGVDAETAYPKMFHIGFLVPDSMAVGDKHARLVRHGVRDLSDLQLERGALRFYVRIPGGLLVEVGHDPAA